MWECTEEQERMKDQPKVRAMYEAVIALIGQGRDIGSIKVSDITSQAGIGKGTAYEYFSNKEEIIYQAILYQMQQSLERVYGLVQKKSSFQEKIGALFSHIRENYQLRKSWVLYACFQMQTEGLRRRMMQNFLTCTKMEEEIREFVELMIESARGEGLWREGQPSYLMLHAILSQIMGFGYYLEGSLGAKEIGAEEFQNVMYENICKMIG